MLWSGSVKYKMDSTVLDIGHLYYLSIYLFKRQIVRWLNLLNLNSIMT